MLRLLTLLVLILNVTAKLFNYNAFDDENGLYHKNIKPANILVDFVNRGDPLWVLSLSGDDWMAPKLRLGNTAELKEFFHYIQPSIINTRRRRPVRVKKDDPNRQSSNDYTVLKSISDAKKEFMLMINKFALSSTVEPDAYISDNTHSNDNSPSIALHFKGPYSVMIVELGRKQWHYFISSQSSLPEWFYEKHDTRDNPIIIPEDVKIHLFSSLWRLLHVFFSLPV